jgi:uncharacterized membrane protein YfcA
MNMDTISSFALLLLGGGFVGILSGLLGVGGAFFIVPLLYAYFSRHGFSQDMAQHLALGTSVGTIHITAISTFLSYRKFGSMRYDLWKTMLPGIIVGTFCGSLLAPHISGAYLRAFFAIFILLMGIQMFRDAAPLQNARRTRLFLPASLLIGFISSLVGVAGTFVCVTFFIWAAVDWREALGTATALSLPITFFGAVGYVIGGWSREGLPMYSMGFVYLPGVVTLSLSSVVMAALGARLAHHASFPVRKTKKIFSLGIIIFAIVNLGNILLHNFT